MKELLLFISGAMVGNMIGIATMALAIASKEGEKMRWYYSLATPVIAMWWELYT